MMLGRHNVRVRSTGGLIVSAIVLAVMTVAASLGSACNIPVFRYALERWVSDDCEAIVFHRGELSAEDQGLIQQLRSASTSSGGTTNLSVLLCDLDAEPAADLRDAYSVLAKSTRGELRLPHLALRRPGAIGGSKYAWSSPLDRQSIECVLDSPARVELGRRLLGGDSVVWLLVKSADDKRNLDVRTQLQTAFKSLQTKMNLPDGIGLPGSELYSVVPLLIQFSVLEIAADDPQERLLVQMLSRCRPDAFAEGEPLLVPVFGRGRALEVLPASDATSALVEDLTMFLGAACSCQVKEQNPGFDLLLGIDWNTELFGEGGSAPPASAGNGNPDQRPVLLTIPPGRKPSKP